MVWTLIQNFFIPTKTNAYRPKALGRTSLLLFFALTLAVEGFLVVGLIARESDAHFLASAITVQTKDALALSFGSQQVSMQSMPQQLIRIVSTLDLEHSANYILGGIATVLLLLLGIAFFHHLDVQSHDMLLGGLTVAAIALVCLLGNTLFLSPEASQTAAVVQVLDS